MKANSRLFDRIRIKPDEESRPRDDSPPCEWPGCEAAGAHPAPKGRDHEGEYHRFCMDHVRLYNKSYNYFAGMKDDAITDFQKAAQTGHRPTWTMGVNRRGWQPGEGAGPNWSRVNDPFVFFRNGRPRPTAEARPAPEPRRKLKNLERRALEVLDLDEMASGPEIKARYKLLLKRHHPDANGGDRSSEGRLQEIIQAYKQLKAAGFC